MEWAAERARTVLSTLDGAFAGDGIVLAVAALDPDGPVIAATEGLPPDARFEIGSVTKTMTATLLAMIAGEGAINLDDRVGRWLDAGQNADITLGELATHTSGLPRDAANKPAASPNPYRDFTAERAEESLRAVARKPEDGRVYSNFGYQLLGLVLERASGRLYQDLLAERLLEPLGMTCSGVGAAGGGTRLTGHAAGRPIAHWDHALPGAGGVEASITDLARYLAACLTPPEGRLGDAIRMCLRPRVRIGGQLAGGLGWTIGRGQGVCSHNGGTGGFSASTGLRPESGQAIGGLVNTSFRSAPLLDSVVLAALTGSDAGRVRPRPTGDAPGPERETRARHTGTSPC
jgi:D-alanyl-D-alanine-carboxypeptidase/D-alanyl-D-alanine-endopeptidase